MLLVEELYGVCVDIVIFGKGFGVGVLLLVLLVCGNVCCFELGD